MESPVGRSYRCSVLNRSFRELPYQVSKSLAPVTPNPLHLVQLDAPDLSLVTDHPVHNYPLSRFCGVIPDRKRGNNAQCLATLFKPRSIVSNRVYSLLFILFYDLINNLLLILRQNDTGR